MKIALYLLAAGLGLLGFIFIVGSQGDLIRIVIGILLFAGCVALIYVARARPQVIQNTTTVVQKIDLSGNVNLEKMQCQSCHAPLSAKSVNVQAGAIFINCEHCGAAYQLEEAPKW